MQNNLMFALISSKEDDSRQKYLNTRAFNLYGEYDLRQIRGILILVWIFISFANLKEYKNPWTNVNFESGDLGSKD